MSEYLLIPRTTAQAIMNYLATRPAGEVLPLVDGLRDCEPAPPKDD
jgi:hypothetical protein